MHAQLEELWIDAMEMKVGEQITTYLRKNHPEYQEIEARQKKLIEDYPMLWKVVDGDGTVTLNEKEHGALKEYLSNQDDMGNIFSKPMIIDIHWLPGFTMMAFPYRQSGIILDTSQRK